MDIITNGKHKQITDKQLMASTGDFIPHQKVEWLQSTGSQFIWLGVMSDKVTDVKVEFEVMSYPTSDFHAVYGAEQSMSDGWNHLFLRYDYNGTLYAGVGNGSGHTLNLGIVGKNTCHSMQMHKSEEDPYVTYDGKKITFPYQHTKFSKQMSLFTHDGSAQKMGKMKIMFFSCKTSDGEEMHLYPVKVDGIGKMYDAVSGRLLSNAGSGNFIIGPDKK